MHLKASESIGWICDWKYPKHILDIIPFNEMDSFENFSISPEFSHNEWVIIKSPASKLSPGREMKSTDNLLITFQKTVKN